MAKPQAGYIGIADIGGTKIRCSSFSVQPKQTVLFYNHIIGLRDTIPADDTTKGPMPGEGPASNIQRRIWRPSVQSIQGGISFFATENGFSPIFDLAKNANLFDLDYKYYCAHAKTFKDCRVNTFDVSCTAGDEVQASMDIVATTLEDGGDTNLFTDAEKLVTWDQAIVTVATSGFPSTMINGFSLKINNNVGIIYIAGDPSSTSLAPYELRVGMQEVSGDISVYLDYGEEFIDVDLDTPTDLTIDLPNCTIELTVVFESANVEGVVGPVITRIPFVGVDRIE